MQNGYFVKAYFPNSAAGVYMPDYWPAYGTGEPVVAGGHATLVLIEHPIDSIDAIIM